MGVRLIDETGKPLAGTAGTPAGGVLTVQGTGSGGAISAVTPLQSPLYAGPNGMAYPLGQYGSNGPLSVASMGVDSSGILRVFRVPDKFKPITAQAVTAGTPVAVWTPASAKKFRLMGGGVSLSVAGYVIFKDASTVIWQTPMLQAGVPYNIPENLGNGILSAAANNILYIDVSATGTVNGGVFGTEE